MKRREYIFIIFIIFVAVLWFVFSYYSQNTAAIAGSCNVLIQVNGEILGEYSLADDQFIPIVTGDDNNTVCIQNKTVYMASANCPDLLCTKMQPIQKNGQVICCLPHKLIIKIISVEEESAPIDAYTF